jgi:nicotinamidase-related amidase
MTHSKALLVIDVQNALCHGKGATYNALGVIDNINLVASRARQAGAPIIFVQHDTEADALRYQSEGWQLPKELESSAADIYVRKKASDSFKKTDLKDHLDRLDIQELIICGMQSEFCVDSTLRCALSLGYTVTVIANGHTTVDNDIIPASTISKHHNCTWENITSYNSRAAAINANEIVL